MDDPATRGMSTASPLQDLRELPLEEARACVTLAQEFGLTYLQIGERVGRGKSVVSNLVRLMNLSQDLLELLDRGLLSKSQGIVLLMAQDQKSRRELARAAIEKHWTVGTLEARVRESNADQPRSREGSEEVGSEGQRERDAGQARDPEQERNPTTMDVARVWGDVLGVAVRVRTLRTRKVRLEVEFPSIEAALAWGGHLGKAVARGSKRR